MTVQAKIPASRAGGPGGPGGGGAGPIAAPRVVNNRRLRAGGIALAIMLVALGMALSAIALVSATRTSSFLAMKNDVQIGQKVTAGDLTTVQLSGGAGLSAVSAADINKVVGQYAKTSLIHGTLLSLDELSSASVVVGDAAQIGIAVKGSNMPAKTLQAGDKILLIPASSAAAGAGSPTQFNATVVSTSTPGGDGSVTLYVAVPLAQAPQIVNLYLNGGLGIILQPAGS